MSIANKISLYNRKRKWKTFLEVVRPEENTTILDVGFNDTVVFENDNFLERNYQYRKNITALGIEEPVNFNKQYPEIKAVTYDGKIFPFADKEFDIVWSNAVLEHVGDFDRQLLFLKEIKRTGKRAFISTPNRLFPFEVHTLVLFLHWLPRKIFHKYLLWIGKEWATGDYMYLLSRSDIKKLLRDAGITRYRIFANRLMGFTLDFVMYFGDIDA
ncbi:MAG: methyltransferase domain-containing protein [Bacteroidales bacterium]|nr:methyltransferase domain-containing protein [Bacteroidales bacterium]